MKKITNKYILPLVDISDNLNGKTKVIWKKGNKYKICYEDEYSYIAETENKEDGKYGIEREVCDYICEIITCGDSDDGCDGDSDNGNDI